MPPLSVAMGKVSGCQANLPTKSGKAIELDGILPKSDTLPRVHKSDQRGQTSIGFVGTRMSKSSGK